MKTKSVSARSVMTQFQDIFRTGFILVILFPLALASCSDDEKAARPDTREQFVGNYAVEDISASGNNYEYDVSISKGAKGDLEITNFADILNVPVKATAEGNQLIIKSQSFTNPSGKTLKVEGSGTLAGGVLTFKYTTTGALDYSGNCTAKKK
ncbi:MAG TPA: hypothetical protein VK658_08110 [Chryseolinea sp.]|nr:hypothetical protein [Chryseolinea sp.]